MRQEYGYIERIFRGMQQLGDCMSQISERGILRYEADRRVDEC